MSLFANYYQRLMTCARHPKAPLYLGITSFIEASVFPIAPDILLVPMILAEKHKAWRYAFLTTIASALGGVAGYWLGHFFGAWIEPHFISWGYAELYIKLKIWYNQWGVLALLLAGITPIPFKLFTLTSGMLSMAFLPFVLTAFIGRAIRFFAVSWGVYYYGERAQLWASKHSRQAGWVAVMILCFGYFLIKT